MTLITFQDGKPVLRDGKVGTEQACCCSKCECGPINCTVTFSVDGVEYTWNVTGPGNETFYVLPDGYLCFETVEGSGRLTEIQGCAICENGKYKIAVGVVMQSLFTSGDCYRWCPEEGRYIDVFYQKAKLHILEVSACDCTAIIDLGVQEFEMFTGGCEGSFGATASACLALAGNFVSYTSCGEICGDYEGPPDECQEPPVQDVPDPVSEMCDPASYTISDVSAECCGNEFP